MSKIITTYYAVGYRDETDENFEYSLWDTIYNTREEAEKEVNSELCSVHDYEIVKVTQIIERE